jgi:hypothetical protein
MAILKLTPSPVLLLQYTHVVDLDQYQLEKLAILDVPDACGAAGGGLGSSSQGLRYAVALLYTIAGWRVPLVLVDVSPALSSPIPLELDHHDVLAARDSGFLQIPLRPARMMCRWWSSSWRRPSPPP